jgi:hypothetical protein
VWFGLPHLRADPPVLDDIVFVKLAELGDVTNVPPETPEPIKTKPKPDPKPRNVKLKPPPPPMRQAAIPPPPPTPIRKPEPKPEPAAVVAPPKAPPKPAPKPTPKVASAAPKPQPRPKPRPVEPKPPPSEPTLSKPVPAKKPKQPPAERKFSSLLKDLKKEPPKPVLAPEPKQSVVERARAAARNQSVRPFDPNAKMMVNEIEAVRQQLVQCWNVAAGARRADALSVEIEMVMNPDATVHEARVVDSARMNSDPYFRAAAESAVRALVHPDCIPLKLPLNKYGVWKNFTFNFDPSKMLQ